MRTAAASQSCRARVRGLSRLARRPRGRGPGCAATGATSSRPSLSSRRSAAGGWRAGGQVRVGGRDRLGLHGAPIGSRDCTKSCAIAEDHSAPHRRRARRRTPARYGSTSAGWSGSANPMTRGAEHRDRQLPVGQRLPRLALGGERSGRPRGSPAACRSPASVASRDSSASIASSPRTPRLTRRRSRAQRRSVSTASPSSATVPSSRPARNSRSRGEVATAANART